MTDKRDDVAEAKRVAEAIDEIGVDRLSGILTDAFAELLEKQQDDDEA